MALWTARDAAAATGGEARGDWVAQGISIDTRTLAAGDLFVALKAARDGHEFVAQALAKGAAAALVSHIPDDVAADAPLLVVPDVLAALEALGRAGRARMQGRVAAITGSVGKTSAKDMLAGLLRGQGNVHAAEASYNNHWGVPLTLARMPADTDFAVIEIGMNHPGEIAPLARIARPDVALITTIAPAHIGAFENLEGIAREKAAIMDGLAPDGIAVLPLDVAHAGLLTDTAKAQGARVLGFGAAPDAAGRLVSARIEQAKLVVEAQLNHAPAHFTLDTVGQHFALNAIAVLLVVGALGADAAQALRDLAKWHPSGGRGAVLDLGGVRVIDDAYNANQTSMAAGLATLAAFPAGAGARRIAVLGDMLELGPDEAAQHAALADLATLRAADLVHCVGPRMRHLHEALPDGLRGKWVERAEDLAAQAGDLARIGDIVLVKGSKGSRVALVVDALRKARQSAKL